VSEIASTFFKVLLLCCFWFASIYANYEFKNTKKLDAIIAPDNSGTHKNGEDSEVFAKNLIDQEDGEIMTNEELERSTTEYERNLWFFAGMAILSGVGTFVMGFRLFDSWVHALIALVLGPMWLAFCFYRKGRFH
jgi:hypothetical protein